MSPMSLLQIVLYFLALLLITRPLGTYMATGLSGRAYLAHTDH